ncbi:MAG: DUF2318 domain-containing protein [Desulfobacterales bacterium]|nr:DUF2318 domain-containing protein [Desulfobacterales bacterium]
MKLTSMLICLVILGISMPAYALFGEKFKPLKPKNGTLSIPVKDINDGQAHYFKVKADDGVMVSFFTVKSQDGIIRAAIDSCDVCYKSGKGYVQDGDIMICTNCGRRFASIVVGVIVLGISFVAVPKAVSYITTRNLDDAIYKLDNTTFKDAIVKEIEGIEGVAFVNIDKHDTRLVITFDRRIVNVSKFVAVFEPTGNLDTTTTGEIMEL